jgi:hypothetical protein
MRDEVRPSVLLGHELQLNLIEMRKADRLGIGTCALADWACRAARDRVQGGRWRRVRGNAPRCRIRRWPG